jgi:hypothetical protein
MKKMNIKNWTSCIQDRNNWKLYVEKGKHSTIEIVASKEEEEKKKKWRYSSTHILNLGSR